MLPRVRGRIDVLITSTRQLLDRAQAAPGFAVLRESEASYEAHFHPEMISVSAPAGLDFCES